MSLTEVQLPLHLSKPKLIMNGKYLSSNKFKSIRGGLAMYVSLLKT